MTNEFLLSFLREINKLCCKMKKKNKNCGGT